MLKMSNLEICFKSAIGLNEKYVGLTIKTPNSEEIIIIKNADFSKKLEYYKSAYTYDLELKTNNNVKIKGFVYSSSFKDIESYLMGEDNV